MGRRTGVKVELAPTQAQRGMLASFAGTSRFAWNWAVAERNAHYHDEVLTARARIAAGSGEAPVRPLTSFDLINRWSRAKADVAPWSGEIASQVATQAILDLGLAFSRYLDGRAGTGKGPRVGLPRFKAKGRCRDSFRVSGDTTEPVRDAVGTRVGVHTRRRFPAEPTRIRLPRIGWVAAKEDPTSRIGEARVTSVTVSRTADRWYASLAVEHDLPEVIPYAVDPGRILGIDVGIKTFAVLSDGSTIQSPRPLEHGLVGIRRRNRDIARKRNARDGVMTARMQKRAAHQAHKAGLPFWPDKAARKAEQAKRRDERKTRHVEVSARLAEPREQAAATGEHHRDRRPAGERVREQKSNRLVAAELDLARAHRRVTNVRSNFLHETTTRLVRRVARAGMSLSLEDLRLGAMMNTGFHLGRAFSDLGLAEFRRQLTYKAAWAGVPLHVAPANYASSKTCSRCGEVKSDLTLSERTFRCARCGLVLDRDHNAARNLRSHAVMAIARGESVRPGDAGQDSEPSATRRSRRLAPARKPKAPGHDQAQTLSEAALPHILWRAASTG